MTKVLIDEDEWYPVFSLTNYGDEAELTDEEIDRINKANHEFELCQDIMKKALRKAGVAAPDSETEAEDDTVPF